MSFGYSVGDLIAGANLAYKLVRLMSDSRGASDEYLQAMSEVSAMQQAFIQVGTIRTHKLLPPATVNATSHIVLSSLDIITAFLKKTEEYHSMLENGSTASGVRASLQSSWYRIGWTLYKSQELVELRDALRSRLVSVQTLLSSASYVMPLPSPTATTDDCLVHDKSSDAASTGAATAAQEDDDGGGVDRSTETTEATTTTTSSNIESHDHPAPSPEPASVHTLWDAADALGHDEYWAEAETIYRLTLDLNLTGSQRMQASVKLGTVLLWQRRHDEAAAVLKRALAFGADALGDADPDTIACMDSLAEVLFWQGRHDTAEDVYRCAFAVKLRTLGERHPEVLSARARIAQSLDWQGRHAAAEALYRDAIVAQTRVLGPAHDVTLGTMGRLSQMLSRLGRPVAAEALYRDALERNTAASTAASAASAAHKARGAAGA